MDKRAILQRCWLIVILFCSRFQTTLNFSGFPWYGRTECLNRRVCGNSDQFESDFQNCYCDFLCHEHGDCCEETKYYQMDDRSDRLPSAHQFSCESYNNQLLLAKNRGFPVVFKCKSEWADINGKNFCEGDTDDLIMRNPVTDLNAPYVIYKTCIVPCVTTYLTLCSGNQQ